MEEPRKKLTDADIESYIIEQGYSFLRLPNGQYIYYDENCAIGWGGCWGQVIISGEKVTLSNKKYRQISAVAGCSLLFVVENCLRSEENKRDYDHDPYDNEIYLHTKLMLVNAEGKEVYLGQIGEPSKEIKSTNIQGGVSFEVYYQVSERKSYPIKYKTVDCYVYCEVYYLEGKDYVEVIEKRAEGSSYGVGETNAYRLYFSTGIKEKIKPGDKTIVPLARLRQI